MAFAAIYVPEFMVQAVVRRELHAELQENLRCPDPPSHITSPVTKSRLNPQRHATKNCHSARSEESAFFSLTSEIDFAAPRASRGGAIALIDAGAPPLFSVIAANAAAQQAGIFLGMTKANAAQFSEVEIRARSLTAEKAAHAALRDVGWSVSPRLEETAPDLIILDVSGLSALLGTHEQIAELLAVRAADCGLRVNVAIAENLLAAEVAARGFPGITLIAAGEEAARIGELPISMLSPPEEMAETLALWGIKTCAQLARLPVLQLSERLGQAGVRLRILARGAASRALLVAEAGLTFAEEMELDDAVEELEPLSFVLGRLLNQLCARLSARALAASLLRVRFDLQPAFENALDVRTEVVRAKSAPGTYERTMQLPVPMRDAKLLLKLLRLRLQGNPPGAPIVKVLVAAEAARPRVAQGGLFLPSCPDVEKLELTLARLAGVVGEGNVGSAESVDTHRPGDFRMRRFSPLREEVNGADRRKSAKKRGSENVEKHLPNQSAMSFRVFRPPLPIHVNSREGRPAEVFLQGRRAEVRKASGPWRTSGEWWREEQWSEDEWDLEVCFAGGNGSRTGTFTTAKVSRGKSMQKDAAELETSVKEFARYRIYFDVARQSWFARGMYD
jgi:protein ImuB